VGLDNIDMDECARRNIAVFPATGANTVSVAEYVIGATLVGLRDVWKANADVLAGKWPRNDLMLGEASGRRLALIGFGGIARAVASRAKALEMKLSAFDPHVPADDAAWAQYGVERETDLDALLAKADVISLHVPFTPQTRNLIDAARLAKMKPAALLINTARGGIIDEAALASALTSGKLGGAVLDVYEQEPLKAGSVLDGVPRLWLTPHIAGVTAEGNIRVSTVTVANVRRELQRLGIKGST
jgi:(S)-sulfolactate dehydrogenase